jgi:heat shock protein HslJ
LWVWLAVLLAGCGGGPGAQADPLANTRWRLAAIGGADLPALASTPVTLEFDGEGKAGGNSGCNSYGGSYEASGERITFRDIASTLMACTDPGVMELEQAYLAALNTAERFEVSETGLTIWYAGGETLSFTRQ